MVEFSLSKHLGTNHSRLLKPKEKQIKINMNRSYVFRIKTMFSNKIQAYHEQTNYFVGGPFSYSAALNI